MAGNIRLNSDQVRNIASDIEKINQQLAAELQRSKEIIDNLANTWTGEASSAAREAYSAFSAKYFKSYSDIIDQYVKFLRTSVADGGDSVEDTNISLSRSFE